MKIKPVEYDKLANDTSFVERKIVFELDAINAMKESFLSLIGTNMKEYYQINERELYNKDKNNKLISKKEFNLK